MEAPSSCHTTGQMIFRKGFPEKKRTENKPGLKWTPQDDFTEMSYQ